MKRFIIAAAAFATIAGGCYVSDATGVAGLTARPTRVFVTDDPFPYDTVARVDLYIESIAINTSADTSATANWVTLATPNRRINLLDYQNGDAALLDSASVPAGQYGAVRVVLDTDSSRIVATTGAEMHIDWQSSAGHPTLYAYVEHPIGIPDSGAAVVVDFDVGQSFFWETQHNHFIFSPVFRAVERGATGAVDGTLVNSTGAPLAFATIGIYAADDGRRGTARTQPDGSFHIAYVLPGDYVVKFEPQPGDPDQPTEAPATVVAGQTTTGVSLVSRFCSATTCPSCPIEGCAANDTLFSGGNCQPTAGCDSTHTDSTHTDSTQTDSTQTDSTGTAAIARISVAPDTQQVFVGDTVRFTATAYDALGRVVPDVSIGWAVRDSAFAAIDGHGLVTGLAPGSTAVIAVGPHATGTAALFVKSP
jgi:hypothetical protein